MSMRRAICSSIMEERRQIHISHLDQALQRLDRIRQQEIIHDCIINMDLIAYLE